MVYTAFAISAMLGDWSGVDVPRAISFTKRCMSYEGGFGQVPGNEAQGESLPSPIRPYFIFFSVFAPLVR